MNLNGIFYFTFFICCTITVFSQDTVTVNRAGELKFEEETHNFGTIIQKTAPNNKIKHEFIFVNSGNKPIKIYRVTASGGGCSPGKWSSEPIAPGEKGMISVVYDGYRLGPFQKSVIITSDAKTPNKVIFIKGEVITLNASP